MKRKMRILIENNLLVINNYNIVKKIELSIVIVDNLEIIGNNLKVIEIEEGKIKVYGEIKKIEFI